MKILATNDFVSERMKVKPITNTEWEQFQREHPMSKFIDKRVTKMPANKTSKEVFTEFGNVLRLRNNIDYITIGYEDVAFVKEYHPTIGLCLAICHSNIESDEDASGDWNYIRFDNYIDTYPSDGDGDESWDIVEVWKTHLTPKNLQTVDDLKNIYETLGLHSLDD